MASAADVEAWCEDQPGGNIGLRLPLTAVGVDVDAYKGPAELAAWQNLVARFGPLPDTAPWCSSRDDGISGVRLLAVPDGYEAVTDLGLAGEVIQHFHRYVVAPPSIHPDTGQPYRWVNAPAGQLPDVRKLPPLPAAWLDGLRPANLAPGVQQPHRTGWTDPDIDALIEHGIPADGQKHDDKLRDVVWKLHARGHSRPATYVIWQAIVTRTPLKDPRDPWTAADFERHWNGADRKHGRLAFTPPAAASVQRELEPNGSGQLSRIDELRGALIGSDGLDTLPVPEPVIDGLLYRDSLAWLHGKPGHCKSFVALDWACCIDAGLPWMGLAVTPGRVLYVIAEGTTGLRPRVRAWEDRAGQKTGVIFLPVAVQMLQPADTAAIAALAAELGCVLVVIDTQARVTVGADENSAVDMGRLVVAAEQIRMASGACVQFVHHEARGGDNLRGSTALEGAATTILRVVKDGSRIELTNPKQKDTAEADSMVLWVVPRLQSVVIAGQPEGPTLDLRTESETKILKVLLDSFGTTGASASLLRETCGLPKSTFHWALNRLVKDGLIQNLGTRTRSCYVPAQTRPLTEVQQVQRGPSPTGPMSNATTQGVALDHRTNGTADTSTCSVCGAPVSPLRFAQAGQLCPRCEATP